MSKIVHRYVEKKMNIAFPETDPWDRDCHIIKVFTKYGFYSHVELEELSDNKYWMLETGQFAANVWEEQKAWQRGTPPCPLWAAILHSLAEINYTIALDTVSFNKNSDGYVSTFHFEKIAQTKERTLEKARREIRNILLPICSNCKKIRDDDGHWQDAEVFITNPLEATFTHGICLECAKKLYPGLYDERGSHIVREPELCRSRVHEKRNGSDRRSGKDRRSGLDGKHGLERIKRTPAGKVIEMRNGSNDRRRGTERRNGGDRRASALWSNTQI
jgi:hypothetical protein